MKHVTEIIEKRARALGATPFFRRLERSPGRATHARAFAPALTFWVMTFQDTVRMNRARVVDPALQRIAEQHLAEDAGHEQWFWQDLRQLSWVRPPEWYFGAEVATVRELSFEIVAEVLRARDDTARIALILALEATGEVFFSRVSDYFARSGLGEGLHYFGLTHRHAEASHELFEAEADTVLGNLALSPDQREEALGLVARVFSVFERLGTFMEARIEASEARTDEPAPTAHPS